MTVEANAELDAVNAKLDSIGEQLDFYRDAELSANDFFCELYWEIDERIASLRALLAELTSLDGDIPSIDDPSE